MNWTENRFPIGSLSLTLFFFPLTPGTNWNPTKKSKSNSKLGVRGFAWLNETFHHLEHPPEKKRLFQRENKIHQKNLQQSLKVQSSIQAKDIGLNQCDIAQWIQYVFVYVSGVVCIGCTHTHIDSHAHQQKKIISAYNVSIKVAVCAI